VVLALLPVALLVAAYLAVAAHLLLPSLSQRLVEGRRQVIRQALAAQVGRRKPVYQDGQLTLAAQSAEDDRLGGLFAVRIGGDGAMTACYAPTARWVADGGDGDDQPALGLEMREARLMHIDAAGEGGRVVTAAVPAWSVRIPTGRQDFSQQSDSLSTVALYQRMRSAPEGSERERRYLRSLERAWHLRWMLPVAALAYWAFAGGLALSIGRGNRMLAVCAGLVTVVATIFPAYVLAREVGEKLPFDSGWWVWPAPLILAAVGGWMLWRRR
jgi:lipopolysaccharide export LptBFGC system permease protein LptF